VKRNLVKRRLRAIAREVLVSVDQGEATSSVSNNSNFDVVVRALPGSAELEWNKLREEMLASINKQLGKGA
jgi:ribonuclease P protein component